VHGINTEEVQGCWTLIKNVNLDCPYVLTSIVSHKVLFLINKFGECSQITIESFLKRLQLNN